MTQQDFICAFATPTGSAPAEYEDVALRVRERLRGLSDEQQFRILYPVAAKSQFEGDFPVSGAAILLRELSPDCPISCEEAVRVLLPEWDVSLEELPFYLAARFGSRRVRQAVEIVKPDAQNDSERSRLGIILYWLDRYDDVYPQTSS